MEENKLRAGRRTSEQIEMDLADVSDLWLRKMTYAEIAEFMSEKRGVIYTERMVGLDVERLRERWTTSVFDNYNAYINQELNRIDALEAELWRAVRDSAEGRTRDMVTNYVNGEGDITGQQIMKAIEKSGITPRFFDQIIEVQKERRRLLGLYPDKSVTVKLEHKVKGYKTVSPGDWPDNHSDKVIEGQIVS